MDKMSGGNQPAEWMSTHPSHDHRVDDLTSYMPEAMKYYNPSGNVAPKAPKAKSFNIKVEKK